MKFIRLTLTLDRPWFEDDTREGFFSINDITAFVDRQHGDSGALVFMRNAEEEFLVDQSVEEIASMIRALQ